MEVEPGMRCRPGIHGGVLVGGVIVQDHMHGKPFRDRRSMVRRNSRTPQRTRVAISHVPTPGQALPNHQSRQHVQLLRRGPVSVRNAANSVVVPWRR